MLLTAACPWGGFRAGTVSFCEARLCAWVVEPANAWSNLGFLAMGLVLLGATVRKPGLAALRLVGVTSLLVALGSFLFHASGTFAGEVVDLAAMYTISALMLVLELRRLVPLTTLAVVGLYAGLVVGSTALLGPFPAIGIPLFVGHVAAFLALHLVCRRKQGCADYRMSNWLMGTWGVAVGIWLLDYTRLVCDPHNHFFTGHSAWHLLGAVCLGLYYRYQLQFFSPLAAPVPPQKRRAGRMVPAPGR